MTGKFITLEGPEGSGKTTVSKELVKILNESGYKVLLTREPGGVDIAEQIRNVILDKKNTKMDASFLGRSSIIGADGSWLVEGEDNVQRSMGCEISFAEKKNVICSDFLAEMSCHYPDKNKDGQGCI